MSCSFVDVSFRLVDVSVRVVVVSVRLVDVSVRLIDGVWRAGGVVGEAEGVVYEAAVSKNGTHGYENGTFGVVNVRDRDVLQPDGYMVSGKGDVREADGMVGTARCAVRAAYQRRNEPERRVPSLARPGFRPLDAGGDIAARCPYQPNAG